MTNLIFDKCGLRTIRNRIPNSQVGKVFTNAFDCGKLQRMKFVDKKGVHAHGVHDRYPRSVSKPNSVTAYSKFTRMVNQTD